MGAEDLWTYLVSHGFDEDVASEVVVRFLASPCVITSPKTWGWCVATRYNRRYGAKAPSPSRSKVSRSLVPLEGATEALASPEPTPLERAEQRQALANAFTAPLAPKRGGQRGGGMTEWHKDYLILLAEG